eukprot:TRINITY_DN13251_c0_g2_i2.p1 TRINITY_DN13251_c0_g2~~TRINITY_DN13251_c0_g2_i2.p1  ORF type:complete len:147 (+),score=17.07 TRINITY_DN13251_c0_g2_i2:34-441(+)
MAGGISISLSCFLRFVARGVGSQKDGDEGDYYRYRAELDPAKTQECVAGASQAYSQGMAEAASLSPYNAVALGLALNMSVFQREVLGQTAEAIATATSVLQNAQGAMQSEGEPQNVDEVLMTMQLLQDNLSMWSA